MAEAELRLTYVRWLGSGHTAPPGTYMKTSHSMGVGDSGRCVYGGRDNLSHVCNEGSVVYSLF